MRRLREHEALLVRSTVKQQQVLALEILVDDALRVDVHQGLEGLPHDGGEPSLGARVATLATVLDRLQDLPALAVLHDDVDAVAFLIPGENPQDVRVVQILQQLSLQLQPLVVPAVGPDHGLHDAGLPREALRHAVHHAVRALAQELLRIQIGELDLGVAAGDERAPQGLGPSHVRRSGLPLRGCPPHQHGCSTLLPESRWSAYGVISPLGHVLTWERAHPLSAPVCFMQRLELSA
mmetsp:Transcript_49132/g.145025  ORF Transcript_49132/g.145025 Transcript_49132/m.145025 type:complete len:236 (+) Transcript_49132:2077-2784(+)